MTDTTAYHLLHYFRVFRNSILFEYKRTLPARVFATHRRTIDSYQELFNLCPNIIGPEMQRLGCQCPAPEYCFTVEYNEEYGVDIDIEYFEAVAEKGIGGRVADGDTIAGEGIIYKTS